MILALIYIIGCFISAVVFGGLVKERGELTLADVFLGLILFSMSWVSVIAYLIVCSEHIIIWKKRKEER